MKKYIFLIILLASVYLLAIDVNWVKIGIEGKSDFLDELKEEFSKYYTLVPLSKDELSVVRNIMKEQDLGLRKGMIGKLPDMDFVLIVDRDIVKFLDLNTLTVKYLRVRSAYPEREILKYFERFVLYFKLPCFIDKKSKKGQIYVLMDKDFTDLSVEKFEGTTNKVCFRYKNAIYARRLRPSVRINGQILYELKNKDSVVRVEGDEYRIFKDGDEVVVDVQIDESGIITVIDIYKDSFYVLENTPVKAGVISFKFKASKGEDVEQLVFVLSDKGIKEIKSADEFKNFLESAKGVDLIRFVVR